MSVSSLSSHHFFCVFFLAVFFFFPLSFFLEPFFFLASFLLRYLSPLSAFAFACPPPFFLLPLPPLPFPFPLLRSFSALARSAASILASSILSFLVLPYHAFFSSDVWKRPWPYLLDVSMNRSLISSFAAVVLGVTIAFLSVIGRFLGPGHVPLIIRKSCFTTPYPTNPPMGVMFLAVRSYSVLALKLVALPVSSYVIACPIL